MPGDALGMKHSKSLIVLLAVIASIDAVANSGAGPAVMVAIAVGMILAAGSGVERMASSVLLVVVPLWLAWGPSAEAGFAGFNLALALMALAAFFDAIEQEDRRRMAAAFFCGTWIVIHPGHEPALIESRIFVFSVIWGCVLIVMLSTRDSKSRQQNSE